MVGISGHMWCEAKAGGDFFASAFAEALMTTFSPCWPYFGVWYDYLLRILEFWFLCLPPGVSR